MDTFFEGFDKRKTLEETLELSLEYAFTKIKACSKDNLGKLSLLCVDLINQYKRVTSPEKYELYKTKWLDVVRHKSDA